VDARLNRPREEQAIRELGHTEVGTGLGGILIGAFLLSILSVGVVQHLVAPVAPDAQGADGSSATVPFRWAELLGELPTDCSLESFERRMEDALVVGQWALPKVQSLLTGVFGAGNEQAYAGREGWLFHRAGVDYLTGRPFLDPAQLRWRRIDADPCASPPQPDPVSAIRRFHEDLGARGIRLIVMPTPVKAVIRPDAFSGRYDERASPVQNSSFPAFVERLESAGVWVFDPTSVLLAAERESEDSSAYLATDTHWRPQAMAAVAEALAKEVEERGDLSDRRATGYARGALEVSNYGDLTAMLSLPPGQTRFPPESVTIEPVLRPDGGSWRPEPGAEVLLLGDSFSNVYSNREAFSNRVAGREYHWGEGAGLAEQLSFFLRRPVDRIVRNAGGSHATRRDLAQSIARERLRGRDRLEHVRVVIHQFAVRELAAGDWQEVGLPPAPEADAETGPAPAPPRAGGERVIRGTIAARASVPRPHTVPYQDCLFAVHLTEVQSRSGGSVPNEIVGYLWGMRDHVWTEAAGYRVGQQITLRVRSWEDDEVQRQYGTHNRKELDDPELLMLSAFWGEPEE
jgi:alginate O-acetyltransferase complex protein AlgJ